MGVFRKKGSPYWWINWWDPSKKKQFFESTGIQLGKPKREAKEVLKQREGATANGLNVSPKQMKFEDAVEIFKQEYVPRKSVGTQRFYKYNLPTLKGHFGAMKLGKITVQDVETYRTQRQQASPKHDSEGKTRIKNATINREIAALGKLFTFAWKKEWVIKNPVRMLEPRLLPEEEQRREAHYMDFVEQGKICAKAPEFLRDIVELVLNTGVRYQKELLPLRWENVDLNLGVIGIVASKTRAGIREIPLNDAAIAILKRRKADSASEWVFPSSVEPGKHLSAPRKAWVKTLKDARVAYFPIYNLRHTHRTRAKLVGMNVEVMQEVMGHSDPSMAKRYSLQRIDFQRAELNKLCASPAVTASEDNLTLEELVQ
ncbi:MAG: site-specific integrase [Acidobacteriia bacterium]|nr:site-specific integrase [Terriglobia bacterium]